MFNFQFYHSERFLKCSREGSVGGHCLLYLFMDISINSWLSSTKCMVNVTDFQSTT